MIDRAEIQVQMADGYPLDAERLDVSLSAHWSPYVQGTLVCKLPPAPVVAALDPLQPAPPVVQIRLERHFGDDTNSLAEWTRRAGAPVSCAKLTAAGAGAIAWGTALTHHYNGGPIPSQILDLVTTVDDLATDEKAGTLTLGLGGAELRLQDVTTATDQQLRGGQQVSITDWVNEVLDRCSLGALTVGNPTLMAAPVWEAERTAWDTIDDALAGTLICDERQRWRLVGKDDTAPGPAVTLADVTELSRTHSRRDWHDDVVIVWEWNDGVADQRVLEYSTGYIGTKPLVVHEQQAYPGYVPGEPRRSDVLAARERRKGQEHTYTAPFDLTIRPMTEVAITDSSGTRPARISKVTWAWPACTMTITTREGS